MWKDSLPVSTDIILDSSRFNIRKIPGNICATMHWSGFSTNTGHRERARHILWSAHPINPYDWPCWWDLLCITSGGPKVTLIGRRACLNLVGNSAALRGILFPPNPSNSRQTNISPSSFSHHCQSTVISPQNMTLKWVMRIQFYFSLKSEIILRNMGRGNFKVKRDKQLLPKE